MAPTYKTTIDGGVCTTNGHDIDSYAIFRVQFYQ